MTPNLLVLCSDQHARNASACYGNDIVRTPHLDALAKRGARFTQAYTNCPVCVPARLSLATGRFAHECASWDNTFPYHGQVPSWAHCLRQAGWTVDAIGKLHFRSRTDDNGFTREIRTMHIKGGSGDALSSLRVNPVVRPHRAGIEEAGPGSSSYLDYDRAVARDAVQWLDQQSAARPWALFVSFVCPHNPYIAPPEFFAHYADVPFKLPPQWRESDWPRHPQVDALRNWNGFDRPFPEATIRKMNAAYYGLCEFLDHNIGQVLRALKRRGLEENTLVLYISDHGEARGARGLFAKQNMYDESAAIPCLLAGPGIAPARMESTPVSLIDVMPTLLDAAGVAGPTDLPGRSLLDVLRKPEPGRAVFSEYNAVPYENGIYMLVRDGFKYVHYLDGPPQLFHLADDPEEIRDLAADPAFSTTLAALKDQMISQFNPAAINSRARADQSRKLAEFGGEQVVRLAQPITFTPPPEG